MATLPSDRPALPAVRTNAAAPPPPPTCAARPSCFPTPPPADIGSLSDDLLRAVFAHVPGILDRAVTLRHVCKRWRDALEGPPAETPPGAARARGRPPPDSAFGRLVLAAEPRLSGRVDCALLARLLWLSDVGAPPLATAALARANGGGGGGAPPAAAPPGGGPIPPPGWDAPRPHLRSLDLTGCAWRPSSCFRAPPLRRFIGLAPNLVECRAAGMVMAGVVQQQQRSSSKHKAGGGGCEGGGGADGAGGGGRPRPVPVALDAREAALLRAAAAAHPSLELLTVDVAFPLPPSTLAEVEQQAAAAGGGGGGGAPAAAPRPAAPPPPPGAAADLADAVAAAGGPGPLTLGRLSISSRPSAWWYPERPALAAAAAAVGAAAGGPGGPATLELVGLSGEEATALGCAALGDRQQHQHQHQQEQGQGQGPAPSSSYRPFGVRTLIITGCADGAAAWSPALAAAVGACVSLEGVAVECGAWDDADAAGLAGAVAAAAAAGRTLRASLNGVDIGPAGPPPRAPATPDRAAPMQVG